MNYAGRFSRFGGLGGGGMFGPLQGGGAAGGNMYAGRFQRPMPTWDPPTDQPMDNRFRSSPSPFGNAGMSGGNMDPGGAPPSFTGMPPPGGITNGLDGQTMSLGRSAPSPFLDTPAPTGGGPGMYGDMSASRGNPSLDPGATTNPIAPPNPFMNAAQTGGNMFDGSLTGGGMFSQPPGGFTPGASPVPAPQMPQQPAPMAPKVDQAPAPMPQAFGGFAPGYTPQQPQADPYSAQKDFAPGGQFFPTSGPTMVPSVSAGYMGMGGQAPNPNMSWNPVTRQWGYPGR